MVDTRKDRKQRKVLHRKLMATHALRFTTNDRPTDLFTVIWEKRNLHPCNNSKGQVHGLYQFMKV